MDIHKLSVTELLDAIHAGSIAVAEVARQTNGAIERNTDINAIISTNESLLIANANELDKKIEQGEHLPLHGIPILVKDNINTVDFLTTGGTPALADHQPSADAGVITRLKNAGALIVGKTNMHELAFGITSNNAFTGAVHNPYDKNLITGGSSGGSAAAVSANIVPVSLGSDTGGSNRIPASLCGVCGFRPTTGRYPDDGLINLSKTRDTVGIFAHSVSDIVLLDDVLSGGSKPAKANIKELRLAVPRDPFYKALENETAEVIENVLVLLEKSGATLVEIDMKALFPLTEKISLPVAIYETLRELADYLQTNSLNITLEQLIAEIASPDVKHIMEAAQTDQKISEEVYLEALNVRVLCLNCLFVNSLPVHVRFHR